MRQVFSLYRQAVAILPAGGRRFLWSYSWLLGSLAIFDAAALALLALVLAPIANGTAVVLPIFGVLDNEGILGAILVICALLIAKSFFAVLLTWWATRRFPRYELGLGDVLLRAYLAAPWRDRLRKNSVDIMRFSESGVDSTVNSFLQPGATLLAEVTSLVAVIITLALVQPILAASTLGYLVLLAAVLFFWIARHARKAGEVNVSYSMRNARLILEIIAAMKEVTLRNKEKEVADIVRESRQNSTQARANINFLSQFPRYALETGLVGGFVVIGGVGFLLGGVQQAVTAVGLFALAGFRVAPAVVRFQQILSQMIAASEFPRQVLSEFHDLKRGHGEVSQKTLDLPANPRQIVCRELSFRYTEDAPDALQQINFEIPFGSTVAFVGESGSGKSTMIDLLLGLLEPSSGEVCIDTVPLSQVRTAWRERVGYVPQEVALFDATIAQNVALNWGDNYDADRVQRALERAQLWDLVSERAGGIEARVGERGIALSGGQRQRLGIARALYANPLILVMDESTSALDTQTEARVMEEISALGNGITRIIIAHRLSTVQHADRIFFMSKGKLLGHGSFAQLVERFPDFARQAQLAGLY